MNGFAHLWPSQELVETMTCDAEPGIRFPKIFPSFSCLHPFVNIPSRVMFFFFVFFRPLVLLPLKHSKEAIMKGSKKRSFPGTRPLLCLLCYLGRWRDGRPLGSCVMSFRVCSYHDASCLAHGLR